MKNVFALILALGIGSAALAADPATESTTTKEPAVGTEKKAARPVRNRRVAHKRTTKKVETKTETKTEPSPEVK